MYDSLAAATWTLEPGELQEYALGEQGVAFRVEARIYKNQSHAHRNKRSEQDWSLSGVFAHYRNETVPFNLLKTCNAGDDSAEHQNGVDDQPKQSAAYSDNAPCLCLPTGFLGLIIIADRIFLGYIAGFDNAYDPERKAAEDGHDYRQRKVGRRTRLLSGLAVCSLL